MPTRCTYPLACTRCIRDHSNQRNGRAISGLQRQPRHPDRCLPSSHTQPLNHPNSLVLKYPLPAPAFTHAPEGGGSQLVLERPLPYNVSSAWKAAVHRFAPSLRHTGCEHLTLQFHESTYPGHLKEKGYNGVYLQGCADCWVRNVTLLNMDNGVCEWGPGRATPCFCLGVLGLTPASGATSSRGVMGAGVLGSVAVAVTAVVLLTSGGLCFLPSSAAPQPHRFMNMTPAHFNYPASPADVLNSARVTVSGVTLGVTRSRGQYSGHHGFDIDRSLDVLVTEWVWPAAALIVLRCAREQCLKCRSRSGTGRRRGLGVRACHVHAPHHQEPVPRGGGAAANGHAYVWCKGFLT